MNDWETGWHDFIEMCFKAKDKKTLNELLQLFLTPEEKSDISTRFLIVKELIKGNKTQRDIARDLNVSIAKITRGSNELKRLDKKWLDYLEGVFDI